MQADSPSAVKKDIATQHKLNEAEVILTGFNWHYK